MFTKTNVESEAAPSTINLQNGEAWATSQKSINYRLRFYRSRLSLIDSYQSKFLGSWVFETWISSSGITGYYLARTKTVQHCRYRLPYLEPARNLMLPEFWKKMIFSSKRKASNLIQWRCQGWWHPGRNFVVSPLFDSKIGEDKKRLLPSK